MPELIDRSGATALIPEEAMREIIQSMLEYSIALQKFRQVPMVRGQMRMPCVASLPLAYWVQGDTGLKGTSKMTWENKYLNAEEMAVIIPMPKSVLDDADYDIWAEVRPRIAEAMGQLLDQAVLFGVGKPATWPDGIVPAAIAAGNALTRQAQSQTNDLAAEVNNIMGLVESDGFMTNGFAARMGIRSQLRGLRDGNRQLLYLEGLANASTPQTLYSDPIHYVKNGSWPVTGANQPEVITGDWTAGLIGIRQDATYLISEEAVISDADGKIIYNLFQQDMIAMRVFMRLAFQVPNPITRMNATAATRYPFAVLRAAT